MAAVSSVVPSPDHPRSRGEYDAPKNKCVSVSGSSPLSRGIHGAYGLDGQCFRIIPALAGNTGFSNKDSIGIKDHPRSRGEYIIPALAGNTRSGSSPLSRGILTSMMSRYSFLEDHPRSRGEYGLGRLPKAPTKGSSPLSRGIPYIFTWSEWPPGIIPALAGNTDRIRQISANRPDHPRSRGEYRRGLPASTCNRGSSPLSRGIRACH